MKLIESEGSLVRVGSSGVKRGSSRTTVTDFVARYTALATARLVCWLCFAVVLSTFVRFRKGGFTVRPSGYSLVTNATKAR